MSSRPVPDGGSGGGTTEVVVRETFRVLEPVTERADDGAEGVVALLDEAGVLGDLKNDTDVERLATLVGNHLLQPLDTLLPIYEEIYGAVDAAQSGSPPAGKILDVIDDIDDIVDAFGSFFQGLQKLDDVEIELPDEGTTRGVGTQLLDYLLVEYLREYHSTVHAGLTIFGAIEHEPHPAFSFEKLWQAIQNPKGRIDEALNFLDDEVDFSAFILLYYLRQLLWNKSVYADFEDPSTKRIARYTDEPHGGKNGIKKKVERGDIDPRQQLRIPLFSGRAGASGQAGTASATGAVGLVLVPLPGINDKLPGLAVVPYGTFSGSYTKTLNDEWAFNADVKADYNDWGLRLQPKTVPDGVDIENFLIGPNGKTGGSLHSETALTYTNDASGQGKPLVGTADGTRLEARSLSLSVALDYDGSTFVVKVALPFSGRLVVNPQGGFLADVITEGITAEFDTEVGWSSKAGVYLDAEGSLDASLKKQIRLGPLTLNELYFALGLGVGGGQGQGQSQGASAGGVGDSDLTIEGAVSPTFDIGPITANVKRIGVEAGFTFPGDGSGNLGFADAEIGFRPPNGIGLSIDAGPVSGGGQLNFFPEENRYSGALSLQFSNFSITAIGLLKTEIPGGGWSFLVLITAELPPIQLGFGFTLNGIGGLLGLHRAMKGKELGRVVREGSMDSVLFPENVVENAMTIISDLRSIFPVQKGQFVVGPMAKFGWGTPTLLRLSVGVVLQLPTFKIAIMGKMSLTLPDEALAMIDLNLAVLGRIDPRKQRLAIDASLYDSRILNWSVSGDMAMRLKWGDDSRFLLSVGGFHPKYETPPQFPKVDRVKASLTPPGTTNPSIELKGYFAVTPNTVQAGAGVHLLATAGPASVEGRLQFDALVQFNPFKFRLDILAMLSVDIKIWSLTIKLDGTLIGPGPWQIRGTLTIEVGPISISPSVDVTIGEAKSKEQLPTATVHKDVVKAFSKRSNWSAGISEHDQPVVNLRRQQRDGGEGEGPILAHPLGGISVRQTVVPLFHPRNETPDKYHFMTIEKFGNARPARYDAFRVKRMLVESGEHYHDLKDAGLHAPLTEKFGPAQFLKLSDTKKMNSPSFVDLTAGYSIGSALLAYGGSDDRSLRTTAVLEYETTLYDEEAAVSESGNGNTTGGGSGDAGQGSMLPTEGADLGYRVGITAREGRRVAQRAAAAAAIKAGMEQGIGYDPTELVDPSGAGFDTVVSPEGRLVGGGQPDWPDDEFGPGGGVDVGGGDGDFGLGGDGVVPDDDWGLGGDEFGPGEGVIGGFGPDDLVGSGAIDPAVVEDVESVETGLYSDAARVQEATDRAETNGETLLEEGAGELNL
jgi:hypothetical protein